jgi:hypothetical protein
MVNNIFYRQILADALPVVPLLRDGEAVSRIVDVLVDLKSNVPIDKSGIG